MYACMSVCVCASMHVCLYVCVHVLVHVCMYVCVCVGMYVCMYACMSAPHPTPPPPHLYTITMFIVHDKTEGSWKLRGTPSLDPIYIYMYVYLCVFTWLIIYRYISIVISELIRYGNVQILARKWKCLWKFRRRSAIFG